MRRLPAVALAYLWSTLLVSCGGVPPIQDPAGYAQCLLRCKAPGFCAHGAEGWACITPQPTPAPYPTCPAKDPCPPGYHCKNGACEKDEFPPEDCRYRESGPKCPFGMECRPTENVGAPWECQWPVPVPTPTPTPTPVPTAVPTPVPTPTPCIPTTYTQTPKKDKCENCDTCRSYMLGRYWTPENRQPDGRYINFPAGREGDMSVAEFYNPATCFKERQDGTPVWAPSVYCYAAEKECRTITIPCPNPTPTPSPSPTPGPTPTPGPGCPVPSSCPNLITWGVGTVKAGVRDCAYMGANHVPTDHPQAGGFAVCDSTPRWGDKLPGKACNADVHAVCSNACGNWRECEDPRGPSWSVSGPCHIAQPDGYHVKVKLDGPGRCEVTATYPERPVDALGVPVTTNGFVPGSFGFNIR